MISEDDDDTSRMRRGMEALCYENENTMSPEALPSLTLTNTMVYRMGNDSTNNIGTMLIALFLLHWRVGLSIFKFTSCSSMYVFTNLFPLS